MSGPIVRSGPSSGFTQNWDSIFGKKSAKTSAKKPAAAPAKKSPKKKAASKKKKAGK